MAYFTRPHSRDAEFWRKLTTEDPDCSYQDVNSYIYRYTYQDAGFRLEERKTKYWTKRNKRDFILYFKKKGIDITILKTRKRRVINDE